MTIQEFYDQVGGSYDDVVRRLGTEERVRKILGMITQDDNMDLLRKGLAEGDYDTAFRASHTIKGIAMNLSLNQWAEASSNITEMLRDQRDVERAMVQMEKVEESYKKVQEAMKELLK